MLEMVELELVTIDIPALEVAEHFGTALGLEILLEDCTGRMQCC